jgi:hypothetical protein
VDVSGERVGGEDTGAGAIGEVERGDGIDGLGRCCSCSLGGGGRGDGCLGSPLGCGGGLLLAGVGDHDDAGLEQLGGREVEGGGRMVEKNREGWPGGGRKQTGRHRQGRTLLLKPPPC